GDLGDELNEGVCQRGETGVARRQHVDLPSPARTGEVTVHGAGGGRNGEPGQHRYADPGAYQRLGDVVVLCLELHMRGETRAARGPAERLPCGVSGHDDDPGLGVELLEAEAVRFALPSNQWVV